VLLRVALPRRPGHVHDAAWVGGCDHLPARRRDGLARPLREAVSDSRPLEAERAAKAAAVGDVGQVYDLVARKLEHPTRLALQTELAEALAGVVVRDLQAHVLSVGQLRVRFQELQHESGRVAHPAPYAFVGSGAPIR